MSTDSPVEELLAQTMRRAGELALPEDAPVPFPFDDQPRAIDEGQHDRRGRRPVRWWWSVVAAGAAVVLVTFGLAALLRSSPSVTVERSTLSRF